MGAAARFAESVELTSGKASTGKASGDKSSRGGRPWFETDRCSTSMCRPADEPMRTNRSEATYRSQGTFRARLAIPPYSNRRAPHLARLAPVSKLDFNDFDYAA